jgi:hypothetical protein
LAHYVAHKWLVIHTLYNMGAPLKNQNARKYNRVWADIVRKLAVQEDYARLHRVAESLFKKAEEGDLTAIKELGDRLDGKALQEIGGDSDNPITIRVVTGIDTND